MSRRTLVAVTVVAAAIAFIVAATIYKRSAEEQAAAAARSAVLIRPHSPVFGPQDAPVTIVEFFDPACGTCRQFYPIVKQIERENPKAVRVVIRYVTFHPGSDQVVRILEAARMQGKLEPVLEAVLAAQQEWSSHGGGAPNIGNAWRAAASVGLDVTRARRDALTPEVTAILNQDAADVESAGVTQTPTFFVNGRPLPSFGVNQLFALVNEEVAKASGG